MKRNKMLIGVVFAILLVLLVSKPISSSSSESKRVNWKPVGEPRPPVKEPHVLDEIDIHGELYLNIMGKLESNHDYHVINRLGYLGKYQFHKKTLRRIGFNEIEIKKFIKSPDLQERAMVDLTKYNNTYIVRNKLDNYIGNSIGGVKITKEGMLAASHLRGPYAVKKYLKTNGKVNMTDANGTSVKDYLKQFENI